jgi:hypothetical protein
MLLWGVKWLWIIGRSAQSTRVETTWMGPVSLVHRIHSNESWDHHLLLRLTKCATVTRCLTERNLRVKWRASKTPSTSVTAQTKQLTSWNWRILNSIYTSRYDILLHLIDRIVFLRRHLGWIPLWHWTSEGIKSCVKSGHWWEWFLFIRLCCTYISRSCNCSANSQ